MRAITIFGQRSFSTTDSSLKTDFQRHWFSRLCCTLAIMIAAAVPSFSQSLPPDTADDQMGIQSFQSYHGGDIDSVGLSNGTLTLHFPFLSYSQRGKLSLSFNLFYNNQPQHYSEFCVPNANPKNCFNEWGYT